ncbi:MAG: hypothetical protein M1819_005791 [Sarea resinae]|nr:MAG: hypothetical protein M1819_005791 [Sarea resinae]
MPRTSRTSPFSVVSSNKDDVASILSPPVSPSKYRVKNSRTHKTDPKAAVTKNTFEQQRDHLAKTFFSEIDEVVAGGQVAKLASSGGGVRIIWSKTLKSTAGRANWRREVILPPISADDQGHEEGADRKHRHIASIELAEKVISDEVRLLNVIAHEFCHLANFMISNVRNNPHGKEFKEW